MCYFNKCFLGSPISFLETSQFFMHLQPPYKSKKIMSFFSQKDYKMLHRPVFAAFSFLVYLEKYFQEFFIPVLPLFFVSFLQFSENRLSFPVPAARLLQRKCPEAFLSLRASRSEYLLQKQQHLCNGEVNQQRGGIHNGGDQG